jgi:pullulanase
MVRKFILDSVLYWVREYRIDGFRFDLMGLHDIDTMNLIRRELDRIDPSIILYGEGWVAKDSPLPAKRRAGKAKVPLFDGQIACFSDDVRDGIKGSVFFETQGGFINGAPETAGSDGTGESFAEDVKFGIAGSVEHPGVDITGVHYSGIFWAKAPGQTVNYVSAHDNLSLWDKFAATNPAAGDEELTAMNKLAAAIVLTSQGIPFFQAGEEMARTKGGDENSFQSPDSVNMLDWDRKSRFGDLVEYYRGLILLRKTYGVFRLRTAAHIRERLCFLPTEPGIIAYTLHGDGASSGPISPNTPDTAAGSGEYQLFMLAFNGRTDEGELSVPAGDWDILVNGTAAGIKPLTSFGGGQVRIPAKTALVLGARNGSASP